MDSGTSGGGTCPVPIFSHRIASSSPTIVVVLCGFLGAVDVVCLPDLVAAIPWRIFMSFLSPYALRLARASKLTPRVAIVGSGTSVVARRSLAALGRALHLPGDWITVRLLDARLTVEVGGWVALGHP